MYSLCGVKQANFVTVRCDKPPCSVLEVTIKGLSPATEYVFNVVAKDSNNQETIYKMDSASTSLPSNGGGVPMSTILAVSISAIVVVMAIIGYLVYRNHKLQTKVLEIEMPDAGLSDEALRARAMQRAADKGTRAYDRLMPEDEDESSSQVRHETSGIEVDPPIVDPTQPTIQSPQQL
eukprot:TRINITY_DN6976_c0_g3_i2.p1 TRINITY_DN6976_c0_g3~~TRINITY_DN6976_c0_g3_i2.p1  ORF type:complete len:178 (+),score=25.65 TRINITY_DN6976_c0_g3_i2:83-616(+)